jgi:hypothetical protein
MPTVTMDAPRTLTRKTGSRLWISSEDVSMSREPNPSAQMPAGKARHAGAAEREGDELLDDGFMRETAVHPGNHIARRGGQLQR